MKRYFFYVLLFPPALMNLLLVQMQPSDLLRYAVAGYLIAAFPAIATLSRPSMSPWDRRRNNES